MIKNKLTKVETLLNNHQQNIKELTKEIGITNNVNQTLITLLKWKNIEIEQIKENKNSNILGDFNKNLEKFRNLEKTLLEKYIKFFF